MGGCGAGLVGVWGRGLVGGGWCLVCCWAICRSAEGSCPEVNERGADVGLCCACKVPRRPTCARAAHGIEPACPYGKSRNAEPDRPRARRRLVTSPQSPTATSYPSKVFAKSSTAQLHRANNQASKPVRKHVTHDETQQTQTSHRPEEKNKKAKPRRIHMPKPRNPSKKATTIEIPVPRRPARVPSGGACTGYGGGGGAAGVHACAGAFFARAPQQSVELGGLNGRAVTGRWPMRCWPRRGTGCDVRLRLLMRERL